MCWLADWTHPDRRSGYCKWGSVKTVENLLPEEGQAVMGQTIVSQLHGMFQLESQMISNCYGGEKFGDGIYYRLIYKTVEKKKWEFIILRNIFHL